MRRALAIMARAVVARRGRSQCGTPVPGPLSEGKDYLQGKRVAPVEQDCVVGEAFAVALACKTHGTRALSAASILRNHLRGALSDLDRGHEGAGGGGLDLSPPRGGGELRPPRPGRGCAAASSIPGIRA